eukprot:CAMPEP_0172896142 /NCGR_PEP_ID=MMETSP1075-20121228/154807_1 /TAXON_ID=2916 /ORGANISM="Ceratium fusus, Strain PA161109" /LENGTH=101 /DNA_ID=CAMNT_0013751495 /DNA_START=595 /DNA_END=897 /DNA_ORIENTATION=+
MPNAAQQLATGIFQPSDAGGWAQLHPDRETLILTAGKRAWPLGHAVPQECADAQVLEGYKEDHQRSPPEQPQNLARREKRRRPRRNTSCPKYHCTTQESAR